MKAKQSAWQKLAFTWYNISMSGAKDACGVAGFYSKDLPAARHLYFALFALQHRGQESAGITTSDGKALHTHKQMGLVTQVFTQANLDSLPGTIGIGHDRYSTSGSSSDANAQPFLVKSRLGMIAVAHNGNLTNYETLRARLKKAGAKLSDEQHSDSALIARLLGWLIDTKAANNLEEAVELAFKDYLLGSFSLVIMDKDTLIGIRDRNGLRPLCIGKVKGEATIIASETCAIKTLQGEVEREINPAEMVVIGPGGTHSKQLAKADPKLCVFEFVYTARPDSELYGQSVYEVRKNFGRELAREYVPEADIVMPVPDSAIPSALGYAEVSGIPFEEGLVKNRYIQRTFIEPDQSIRLNKVRMKFNTLDHVVRKQRVIMIDDSLVRSTTSVEVVKMLRRAGAREVHFLVASPPIKYPDFYGIDIPQPADLIANQMNLKQIAKHLDADSVHYISLEGMYKAIGVTGDMVCSSCFTGEYPVWPEQLDELKTSGKVGSAQKKHVHAAV